MCIMFLNVCAYSILLSQISYIKMQALWMLLASALFAIMGVFIKYSCDNGASLAQVLTFRGLPFIILIYLWSLILKKNLSPKNLTLCILRNFFGVCSIYFGFYSIEHLQLSLAISLNYTGSLFLILFLFLSKK